MLNRKQISEHFNVTPKTIDNWEREGCPVERTPGINKPKYDPDKVLEWLKQRGNKWVKYITLHMDLISK